MWRVKPRGVGFYGNKGPMRQRWLQAGIHVNTDWGGSTSSKSQWQFFKCWVLQEKNDCELYKKWNVCLCRHFVFPESPWPSEHSSCSISMPSDTQKKLWQVFRWEKDLWSFICEVNFYGELACYITNPCMLLDSRGNEKFIAKIVLS
jgi:hypothetical protein